jgi:hypothetical protein
MHAWRPEKPLAHLDQGPESQGPTRGQATYQEAKKEKKDFLGSFRETHLPPA